MPTSRRASTPRRTLSGLTAALLAVAGVVATSVFSAPSHATYVGPNDFRISNEPVGGGVFFPSLAYNPTNDQYLVVWQAVEHETPDAADVEAKFYVRGQFVNARTGAEIGGDFTISQHGSGPTDVNNDARTPTVTYNATLNEFVVAYTYAPDLNPDNAFLEDTVEVYAQRVGATGSLVGAPLRVSEMGVDDAAHSFDALGVPDIDWNATDNEYLVVWYGDDNHNGLVNGENEVFAQRLGYSGGNLTAIGADAQVSQTFGANGTGARDAFNPQVAWSPAANRYLVVWHADGETGTDDNVFRTYGQLVSNLGAETGPDDFALDTVGNGTDTTLEALDPDVSVNNAGDFQVAWSADNSNGSAGSANDFEIWTRTFTSAGAPSTGALQLSNVEAAGTDSLAKDVAIAHSPSDDHFLFTWIGTVNNTGSEDILGQRRTAAMTIIDNTSIVGDLGPLNSALSPAGRPAVSYSEQAVNGYLAVFPGEDQGNLPAGDGEIWGQLISPASDLQVTKSASPPYPAAGEQVTYTITYTNAGPERDYGISIIDPVPAGLTGVSQSSTGPVSLRAGSNYIWDAAALGPGEGGTITVTGTVANLAEGTVIGNTATITHTTINGESSLANNTQTANVTVDNPPAAVSIVRDSAELTNDGSVTWTVTFDQGVTGVTTSNFGLTATGTISGAAVTSVTGTGATRTVTVDTGTGDGTLGLNLASGTGIVDTGIVGGKPLKTGNLPLNGPAYTIDKTPPTVTVDFDQNDPTKVSPLTADVAFSEDVTGLALGDFTVTNGTATGLTGSGSSYAVEVTPAGDGQVTLKLPADSASDAAGNGNTASNTDSLTYDGTKPTLALTSGSGDPTNDSPIEVTAQFSENVSGFTAADVTPGNATLQSFAAVDGDTYTFELVPAAPGSVTAAVAAGAASDAAGNESQSADFSRVYDDSAPTVTLSTSVTSPTNASVIPVTATISEDVVGFDDSALQVTGGTVGNLATVDGHTYTFDVTPSGDGTVTIQAGVGAVSDAAGNDSPASNTLTVEVDATAPTVTIDQAAGQADPTGTSPITFTVEFSEPVDGFDENDVDLTLSTAGPVTASVSGSGASYVVTVTGMNTTGDVIATIPPGAAEDGAGNPSTASTSVDNTVAWIENAPPTIVVAPGGSCATTSAVVALATTDADGDAITVATSSSNQALLPNSAITVAGDLQSVTIAPKFPKKGGGTATVTLTVSDGSASSSTTIHVIVGTDKTDAITGTSGTDLVFGRNGNDAINTLGAIDVVCGGNGGGVIDGGSGDDTLDGSNGDDDLRGGLGNDILRGGGGTDTLTGGVGADHFSGGAGTDTHADFTAAEGDTTDGT